MAWQVDYWHPRFDTSSPESYYLRFGPQIITFEAGMTLPIDALGTVNLSYAEELYEQYLRDPSSVSETWRAFFAALGSADAFAAKPQLGPSFTPTSLFNPPGANGTASAAHNGASPASNGHRPAASGVALDFQSTTHRLIRAFREFGHNEANIDPLSRPRRVHGGLKIENYGLSTAHLDLPTGASTHFGENLRLRELLDALRETYCGTIGAEYMYIDGRDLKRWFQRRLEITRNRLNLSREQKLRTLTKLVQANGFEDYLQNKFGAAKRFSIEGGESLIALLDYAVNKAAGQGVREVVFAMAHRGRLNTLANVIGKPIRSILREFEDMDFEKMSSAGDVKYHHGYSSDMVTSDGHSIHLSLCYNPSHLEFVNPIAQGRVRGKQDRLADVSRDQVLGFLLHGDSSFAGEGVVQETLNLWNVDAYRVGGLIHIIVNNQIGFTTEPNEARSTRYASDVAKGFDIPILHVNADDPEAVLQAIDVALDFRREFKRDILIDLICYRVRGHNEGDFAQYTNPEMYAVIEKLPRVNDRYAGQLEQEGLLSPAEYAQMKAEYRAHLAAEHKEAPHAENAIQSQAMAGTWRNYRGGLDTATDDVPTGYELEALQELGRKLTTIPPGVTINPKLLSLLDYRREATEGAKLIDWAFAELLAFATLLVGEPGNPERTRTRIRLTGQDSERGTFSSRHAVFVNLDTESGVPRKFSPLRNLSPQQAPFEVANSTLSENSVLGFEYGYSLDWPDGLVLWEAQFGDFMNVAQVYFDQFICTAEDKWKRLSGLVVLLPHGYEGAGSEHSSARMERFLQLAAEDNIQVVWPSTPAQYFHLLRRQVRRLYRKPLIVMTPKGTLRTPLSTLSDLAEGTFRRIIPEDDPQVHPERVRKVLLCTGKLYHELAAHRAKTGQYDVALVRIEQLYPLYVSQVAKALAPFAPGTPVAWVQEEPENMGAWRHLLCLFGTSVDGRYPFSKVARAASASPATGSKKSHDREQADVIERAFR